MIHFSTDCVFDGSVGNYDETSDTTAQDVYGRTKALGELRCEAALTIRSSFVGRELVEFSELLEWFLAQRGKTIRGYTRTWYSGVSTIYLSHVVAEIMEKHSELSGLVQLAIPRPISKYDLLCLARDAFDIDVEIIPDESKLTKPTLNGERLQRLMNLQIPSWKEMMYELSQETMYAPVSAVKNRQFHPHEVESDGVGG